MSRYFTEDHEWVDVDGDIGTVGITEYAQGQLGDIVFVDVPEEGKPLTKGDEAAVVESVKAASDVYSPVSGTVIEGNAALADEPGAGEQRPRGRGLVLQADAERPERARRADGRSRLRGVRREAVSYSPPLAGGAGGRASRSTSALPPEEPRPSPTPPLREGRSLRCAICP